MKSNPLRNVIARACVDAEFRARVIADPAAALAEHGIEIPAGVRVEVHEPAEDTIAFVLPNPKTNRVGQTEILPPQGPVADVPEGLSLAWSGIELMATGRIDGATAPALRRELTRRFSDTWVRLEGVSFMSSAGIAALLAGHKHLAENDAALVLHLVPEPVRNVLELVGMLDAFEIVEPEPTLPMTDSYGFPLL